MPFTHVGANKALELLLAEYSNLYLGAFTTAPTVSGGGTEVVGGSYARVEIPNTDFDTPTDSESDNTALAQFPTATASWGSIVAWGLFDASSSGNLLAWAVQSPAKAVGNGDNVAVPIGNLILRNVAS